MLCEFDMGPLVSKLEDIKERGIDASEQMQVIAVDMLDEVANQFAHGKFQQLAKSTLKRKARLGKGSRPLIFDGGWSGGHEPDSGPHHAGVTSDAPYRVFHVSKQPRSKIPLRDPYAFDQAFWDDAVLRLGEFIVTGEAT